jgi:serine/threonine-protein kinase
LGLIWLARDQALGRDVALKELQPQQASSPAIWTRFVEEAQITGQLEHPGIVPVYELSRGSGDQAPFYTMRFVKGRTLTEAIRAYHEKLAAGNENLLEQRALLNAFVAVCHTIAYAHARGVVHRDLKGQNVVLGDFGEVIVLDWGLAKLLGDGAHSAKSSPAADANLSAGETLAAVALDKDLQRAATMEGQVMGTPAYMAPEQAAGQSDLIGPRTDVHGLGTILYEILTNQAPFQASDTMSTLRQVRDSKAPRPSAIVAGVPLELEAVCLKAMAKNPADRYQTATEIAQEVERWLADEPVTAYPESWTNRAGRWVRRHRNSVTTAVGMLAVAAVCLAGLSGVLARATEREHQAKLLAERRGHVADVQRDEASRQRDKARARFQIARAAVERYQELSESPDLKAHGLERLRTKLLEAALGFYQDFVQQEGDDGALQADRARAYWRLANLYRATGRTTDAEAAYRTALDIQQWLTRRASDSFEYRSDLASSYNNLANLYRSTGRNNEAESAYQQALLIRRGLAGLFPSLPDIQKDLAASYSNLGNLYRATGRNKQAEDSYRKAMEIRNGLARQTPQNAEYQQHLAQSYQSLGGLYEATESRQGAEEAFQNALAIQKNLVAANPDVPDYQEDLAATHNFLGNLYSDLHRAQQAENAYRAALTTQRHLADAHPQVPEYLQRLAGTYNNLGLLYRTLGRTAEAETALKDGLAIRRRLADANPEVIAYSMDLSSSCINVGHVIRDSGNPQAALQWYSEAINTLSDLLKRDPRDTTVRSFLRNAYWGRAAALGRLHRYDDAVRDWEHALELDDGQLQGLLRTLRAEALAHQGNYTRAVAEADDLANGVFNNAGALYNFGCICALSSSAVQRDAKLPQADRDRLAAEYADRAMRLLQRAASVGFPSNLVQLENMKQDADLEILRARADYKKLLEDLDKKIRDRARAKERSNP